VPTASARLGRKLDLLVPAFSTPGRLLLESENTRELFPRYLAASSHLNLAMVPLMEAALARARALAPEDPVAPGLAAYLERHIPEELHGGAPGKAALEDLAALGIDTEALRTQPPPASMAEHIGTLFVWIHHRHPVAVLGFLALERFHPHIPTIELLIEKTGLPRDGFRQLLLHGKLDAHHAEELHRVIDALPLEPEHEQLIGLVALRTMSALIDGWLDVVAAKEPVAATV
jgi:hypothetical protein